MEPSLVEDAPAQPKETSTAWAEMLKWVWKKKGVAMPMTSAVVETWCTGTGSPTIGLKVHVTDALVHNTFTERSCSN
eukprot:6120681-Amphidinium_carterae.1